MKRKLLLTIIFLVFSITCFSQTTRQGRIEQIIPEFTNVDVEIEFYLNKADYSIREGCLIGYNEKQLDRLRLLANENKASFLTAAKEELKSASEAKAKRLVWVLIQAGTQETQPLNIFSQESLKNTFANNASAILSELDKYLKFHYDDPQSVYVLESIVFLKYYSSVPTISRLLNERGNRNLEKTMAALVDLNASQEVAEFVQAKILEVLCDRSGYRTVDGMPLAKVSQTLEILSEDSKSMYTKHFQQIRNQLVFEPNEKTLIKFANEGKTEKLRGTSILLLAVTKTEAGKKVILEHLRTDSSNLVRGWAAQCFAVHPTTDPEVIDALIETYHSDKDHDVRWASISSLGQIRGEKAEEIIREALNDKSLMIKESAERITKWIEKLNK